MNINYASIIEKANDRKLALENLTAELAGIEGRSSSLLATLCYFEGRGRLIDKMDDEGRAMLPSTMVTRIQKLAEVSNHLRMQLLNDHSYAHLESMIALVKGEGEEE